MKRRAEYVHLITHVVSASSPYHLYIDYACVEPFKPTIDEYVKGCFGCGGESKAKYCGIMCNPEYVERIRGLQAEREEKNELVGRVCERIEGSISTWLLEAIANDLGIAITKEDKTIDSRCKHCNDEIGIGVYVSGISPSNADLHGLCEECYLTQPSTTRMQRCDQLNHGIEELKKDIGLIYVNAVLRLLKWVGLLKK